MYDVIVIGSGPAGMTASIYAMRAALKVLVIEKNFMSGGQVLNTYEVDNYPGLKGVSGFDLSMKMREHADALQVPFVVAEVKKIEKEQDFFTVETDGETYQARTVIAASGASHKLLRIPGEASFAGKGVSYCAVCDGAFFRNKTTAVIGGGDVAVEDALFLSKMCGKVYLIHRRDKLRAAGSLQNQLFHLPNVEVLWDMIPVEIAGEQMVSRLMLQHVKTGDTKELEIDGVFVAVGIEPDTQLYKELVRMDESGYIKADETGVTSMPGFFAAGDLRTKVFRQIITAAADGANAAASAERYLNLKKEAEV